MALAHEARADDPDADLAHAVSLGLVTGPVLLGRGAPPQSLYSTGAPWSLAPSRERAGDGAAGISVRLGINPIGWSNDDVPELGGDIPLKTCLAEARLAGYAGIELGARFPRAAGVLRAVLGRHGLDLVSGWWDGRLLERDTDVEFDAVLAHLTLVRELGCRHVVYADTSRRAENDLWRPSRTRPRRIP